MNCRAAEEGDVAWKIIKRGTVLGKSIGLKGTIGSERDIHILGHNFRRDRVLLRRRNLMKIKICFFCVSCFVGAESPVLKEGIEYTLRHGKYIILLRKQVLVPQYLCQQ